MMVGWRDVYVEEADSRLKTTEKLSNQPNNCERQTLHHRELIRSFRISEVSRLSHPDCHIPISMTFIAQNWSNFIQISELLIPSVR